MSLSLIQKYNVPGPRYTSYPTVPYWQQEQFSVAQWEQSMLQTFNNTNHTDGISLYIHLPYCESLCTFCGCHKRITKRHEVENPYIEALLQEWKLYCDRFAVPPQIREIHLGGGTPTFFAPQQLRLLIEGLLSRASVHSNYEFSFEGHPNNTTKEHLQTLYDLGFRRVSFGVQDYSIKVQQAIHRVQPFENVQKVTQWARAIGYQSISHDLVFGLPFQELDDVLYTIQKTRELAPDRLAFYSYAHVPWIKGNGQRGFSDSDLPQDEAKRRLYEEGKRQLSQQGYIEIGMDHFALTTDTLYQSFVKGQLHRNFMGYTTTNTKLMIGLGVSSISDSWFSFAQNEKEIEVYCERVQRNELPLVKGHILNTEDLILRRHILNLMCRFETSWKHPQNYFDELPEVLNSITEMQADGLILVGESTIQVTEKGKPFVRNLCMAFDRRLVRQAPQTALFSRTI